jgi:hypothetical protein
MLEVFGQLGVPPLLIAACQAYADRQRDLLPVFVPFAWCLRATGCSGHVVAHDLPPPEMIGDWPSYVFDPLWTRTGKRAVRLWLKAYRIPPRSTALWSEDRC